MEIGFILLVSLAGAALVIGFLFRGGGNSKPPTLNTVPALKEDKELLQRHSVFYQQLDEAGKENFAQRVRQFLSWVKITGVNTEVEELDRVLVAASAVTPIFAFRHWEYTNLNEVLLYPDSFNHDFEQSGNDRAVLGMVGDGPMNGVMILSKHELRQAFLNKTSKTNTAIHEFVHLLDKTDGSVDGLPELFLDKTYMLPWLELMQKEIKRILRNKSDINPYGATNQAEFFAVVSEYFFERPDLLQEKNPELYALLSKIFRQDPG